MTYSWESNPTWQALTGPQRAAAMALLEAGQGRSYLGDAKNVLGSIINRAEREKTDLGQHVSQPKIYQPLIEPGQEARLGRVLSSPEFQAMTSLAEQRSAGNIKDWVNGATHFLAKPDAMLELSEANPGKYKSWRLPGSWTGYDPETNTYKNQVFADNSHSFIIPPEYRSGKAVTPRGDTPSGGEKNMDFLSILTSLLGSGAGSSAMAGGAAGDAGGMAAGAGGVAGGATPAAGGNGSLFGSLSSGLESFGSTPGGGGQGQGGQSQGGGGNLAAQAMTAASSGEDSPIQPVQTPRFDISRLSQILKDRQRLGSLFGKGVA